MADEAHEQRIAALLAAEPTVAVWLREMRGFAKDSQGRTIVLGLSAVETEEYLRLNVIVKDDLLGDGSHRGEPEFESQRARYFLLREKHDAARR